MKFAIHGPGFINPTPHFPSVPRTILTPGAEADQIPRVRSSPTLSLSTDKSCRSPLSSSKRGYVESTPH